ncbi:hypothetical protein [Planktothricoides raciborskii]|nr:hypothetical protein [Planktothricoides raciborskii]
MLRPCTGEWPFAPTEWFAPTGICDLLAEKIAVTIVVPLPESRSP